MAWTLDSVATPAAATTGTTVTVSHTLGSGSNRKVIAGGYVSSSSNSVSGVTYNGVAMTAVAGAPSGTCKAKLFFMDEASLPAAGTYNVVITFSNTLAVGSPGIGHCVSYSTAPSGAAEATTGQSYGSVSSISNSVTPTSDAATMVAALAVLDPRTITETGSQGTAVSALDGTSNLSRTRLYVWTGPTPAALETSSFTLSAASGTNAQHLAAFAPTVGGAGPTGRLLGSDTSLLLGGRLIG